MQLPENGREQRLFYPLAGNTDERGEHHSTMQGTAGVTTPCRGHGGVGFMVGFDDPKGLFQLLPFYDSKYISQGLVVEQPYAQSLLQIYL